MVKTMKILLLSLLLITSLVLSLATGCGSKETSTETTKSSTSTSSSTALSQAELKQILADSMVSYKNVSSYKFQASMNMMMKTTGGSEPMDMNMDMTMEGVANLANKETQIEMNMSMDSNAPDFPDEMKDVKMDMYMLAGSIYMKMNIPEMGDQWIKVPVSEEMMEQYNFNMVEDQMKILDMPAEVSFLRYETLDGSECYVLKIIPGIDKITQWLGEQQLSGEIDLSSLNSISDAFKELSYILWIDKKINLVKKIDASMVMEMLPEQLGTEDTDFDKMTMDMDMQMTMSNYNQPVNIVLPDEAQNAMEVSQEMMSQ